MGRGYFASISKHTSAADMTAFLGIEPDEVRVRGAERLSARLTKPGAVVIDAGHNPGTVGDATSPPPPPAPA